MRRHLLLLLAWLPAAACRPPAEPPAASEAAAEPIVVGPENTVRVAREIIRAGPRIAGTLEAVNTARVRAETGGAVAWEALDVGRPVTKGELLVRIEDAELREALAAARSALRAAESEAAVARRQSRRTRRLVDAGALSAFDLETAETAQAAAAARRALAAAQLAQVEERLAASRVRSPIDGVLSQAAVSRGDVVSQGAALFTVIDPSSMRLSAAVPSDALPALQAGTRADFEVRGYPGRSFTGRIERVAPAVDPATRQIVVLISVPNPGGELIAGLFAEGRIGAEARRALVAPAAAVDRTGQKPAVVRVRGGKAERVPVELGLADPQTERVELKGGVAEGDLLLTGAAMRVAPGTPVRLTGARAAMR